MKLILIFLALFSFLPDFTLPQTLHGKVTTVNQLPVANARIWLINKNDIYQQFNAYTNAEGEYSLIITSMPEENPQIPDNFKLEQNYPNPFSETTTINYSASTDKPVTLKIYDILGREIKSFTSANGSTRFQSMRWDGTNNNGQRVAQGIYFYQLIEGGTAVTKKMLFLPGSRIHPNSSLPLYKSVLNNKIKTQGGNDYEIIVTNSDSTLPLINAQKINSLNLPADTILNFTVEEKTDPGYYLYLNIGTKIYVVDSYSNKVVDSLDGFDRWIRSFEITSDKKVYVTTDRSLYPARIYSMDLITKEIKLINSYEQQPNGGFISVVYKNNNNSVFVITKDPNSQLKYIGIIENDSVKYFDSLSIMNDIISYSKQAMVFDKDSTVFYLTDNNDRLFSYNYNLKSITRYYNNIYSPFQMIISDDNKIMYVAGGPVFDFHKDSVINWLGGIPTGTMALNSDNGLLYITDPGGYNNLDHPKSGFVFVYDTKTFSYVDTINVYKSNLNVWKVTDDIKIIPGTKLAYVSNWGNHVYLIDLELKEVIYTIYLKGEQVLSLLLNIK